MSRLRSRLAREAVALRSERGPRLASWTPWQAHCLLRCIHALTSQTVRVAPSATVSQRIVKRGRMLETAVGPNDVSTRRRPCCSAWLEDLCLWVCMPVRIRRQVVQSVCASAGPREHLPLAGPPVPGAAEMFISQGIKPWQRQTHRADEFAHSTASRMLNICFSDLVTCATQCLVAEQP
jgi:hypothetical protein